MIKFLNNNKEEPYQKVRKAYRLAESNNQFDIQAITISSYSAKNKEVDSRYVNLKIIDNEKFIFFSNYNSPKAKQFLSHNQISAVLYWPAINTQIRMKCNIHKLHASYSDDYFAHRSLEKNALAISSDQSKKINSYSDVIKNYKKTLKDCNLKQRPEYWGGFYFIPYYFEFWKGDEKRLNKRTVFALDNNIWIKSYLQP